MSIGDFPEGLSQAILVGIILAGRFGVTYVYYGLCSWSRAASYLVSCLLPPGSGRMEKWRQHEIAKANNIPAGLLCASILCAVV